MARFEGVSSNPDISVEVSQELKGLILTELRKLGAKENLLKKLRIHAIPDEVKNGKGTIVIDIPVVMNKGSGISRQPVVSLSFEKGEVVKRGKNIIITRIGKDTLSNIPEFLDQISRSIKFKIASIPEKDTSYNEKYEYIRKSTHVAVAELDNDIKSA